MHRVSNITAAASELTPHPHLRPSSQANRLRYDRETASEKSASSSPTYVTACVTTSRVVLEGTYPITLLTMTRGDPGQVPPGRFVRILPTMYCLP